MARKAAGGGSKVSESKADDERWMRLAIREARKGDPSPNPHVGAVVVKNGKVIAKGHHPKAGDVHAEVMALRDAGRRAKGATLYVTFEPCNHFGRTPPCTDAILAAGISRVVLGARDMAPHKPGSRRKLERAGLEVTCGVLEAEAGALVADFAKHILHGLPYVTLKAGMTLDGRIAARDRSSKWITGAAARKAAHQLRASHDAVLVGVETVLADDPELNVRHVQGRHPVRIVLDSRLRTPAKARVLRSRGGKTVLVHGPLAPHARREALRRAGAELIEVPVRAGRLSVLHAARAIAKRDVVRLLVEGGGAVHGSFLDAGLVDEVDLFVAPKLLGDAQGVPVLAGAKRALKDAASLTDLRVTAAGDDLRVRARVAQASTAR
jgi:diaminohydroxyphosphoribosylaminopyrimidine deaminase/5-amino-6-(5-phosphoribosylamino)uracil reductase